MRSRETERRFGAWHQPVRDGEEAEILVPRAAVGLERRREHATDRGDLLSAHAANLEAPLRINCSARR